MEPTKRCSFDLAAFYNQYDRLIETVQGAPQFVPASPVPYLLAPSTNENSGAAQSYGIELSGRWDVTDWWKLAASYTWFDGHSPGPSSALASGSLETAPQQQFQVRSALDLPHHLEMNTAVYYVDQIQTPYGVGLATIPSYVRLDVGLVWRPLKSLDLGLWGQNLADDRHMEFTSYKTPLETEIPRSVMGKVTWRF